MLEGLTPPLPLSRDIMFDQKIKVDNDDSFSLPYNK